MSSIYAVRLSTHASSSSLYAHSKYLSTHQWCIVKNVVMVNGAGAAEMEREGRKAEGEYVSMPCGRKSLLSGEKYGSKRCQRLARHRNMFIMKYGLHSHNRGKYWSGAHKLKPSAESFNNPRACAVRPSTRRHGCGERNRHIRHGQNRNIYIKHSYREASQAI